MTKKNAPADETGEDVQDELPAPVQLEDGDNPGSPVFIDSTAVTHIHKHHSGNGSSIGTTGGLIVRVIEDVEAVAKLFGWL